MITFQNVATAVGLAAALIFFYDRYRDSQLPTLPDNGKDYNKIGANDVGITYLDEYGRKMISKWDKTHTHIESNTTETLDDYFWWEDHPSIPQGVSRKRNTLVDPKTGKPTKDPVRDKQMASGSAGGSKSEGATM